MKLYSILVSFVFVQFSFSQEVPSKIQSSTWSLNDCINYALKNNITIKNATLNKNTTEINYNLVKSTRLPNLFGSASQSFTNGNSIDPITSNYVTDQIYSTNVGINSSMTLFQGNQLNNQIKQNKLLLNQSILQEEVEKALK